MGHVLELRVSELEFTHVGHYLLIRCPGENEERPYAGTLFDVVHRPGGASWLWFRVTGEPVVLVVEDPAGTMVQLELVEPAPEGLIPRQRRRDRRWFRRAPRDVRLSARDPERLSEPGDDDARANAGALPAVGGLDPSPLDYGHTGS